MSARDKLHGGSLSFREAVDAMSAALNLPARPGLAGKVVLTGEIAHLEVNLEVTLVPGERRGITGMRKVAEVQIRAKHLGKPSFRRLRRIAPFTPVQRTTDYIGTGDPDFDRIFRVETVDGDSFCLLDFELRRGLLSLAEFSPVLDESFLELCIRPEAKWTSGSIAMRTRRAVEILASLVRILHELGRKARRSSPHFTNK